MAQSAPVTTGRQARTGRLHRARRLPDDINRRDRFALLLALAAVVAGLVFTLLPPQFKRSEITWEPASPTASGTLILTRGAPEVFEVESTCSRVRSADPAQPLLSAGSISLTVAEGDLVLRAEAESEAARVPVPTGTCKVLGRYDLATSTVRITVGESSDAATTKAPRVTGLITPDSAPAVDRVYMRTQPTGITTSWLRWSLGLLTLALAGTSLLRLARVGSRVRRGRLRSKLQRLEPVDGAVLVALLVLTVLAPALFDDGWILARSWMLVDHWWFGNLYATNDAWLPQGFLHELVLGWLQHLGWRFVHLRILMAVGLAISWVVLRHYVLAPALGRRDSQRWAAAAAFTAVSGAWLITVRAEPVVVMFGTLTLAAWMSMDRRPRPIVLAIGIITAALAIGAHQTGWVALGPLLFLLYAAVRPANTDRQRWPALITAVAAGGAISLLTVFAAVDLRTALAGGREFAADGVYSAGIFSEPARYLALFSGDNTGARVFTALMVAALALSAALAIGTDSARKRLWLVSFAWLGGVLLTSSKWPWHLGVYAVPATVFAALTADAWRQGRLVGMGRAAVLPMITLLAAMALTFAGRWGEGDLSTLTWLDLSEGLVGGSRRYWWYLAVIAAAALGLIADRGRLRPIAATALALAIVTPLTANVVWIALDAREPGWSFAGSTMRQLSGDDSCGVLSGEEMVVGADQLPEVESTGPSDLEGDSGLAPSAYPHVTALTTDPLGGLVSTWGTWFQDGADESPDAHTGSMRSPEHAVSDTRDLTVWTIAGAAEGLAVRAVFSDDQGVLERTTLPIAPLGVWALHTIDPPQHATSVRLEIEDESTAYGGWAAVSAPVIAETAPAASVFADARAYTSPFNATQYPCVPLPDLDDGYWARTDYAVKTDVYFDANTYHGLTATQVLCLPGRDCVWHLDYQMADIAQRDIG